MKIHPRRLSLLFLILLLLLFPGFSIAREQTKIHPGPQPRSLSTQEIGEIKQVLLEQINRDRVAHKLAPLEYDDLASRVGDAHCQEMLREGYLSHWNRQGLKPYHRYSLAGGRAYVAENAFTYETDPPMEITKEILIRGVLFAQRQFMSETPPNDGHRKNILDPNHTAVGIGLAYSGSGFRLTQEFINHHVTIKDLPAEIKLGSPLVLEGKPLPGRTLGSITLFYEPFPQAMSIKELKNTSTCGLPLLRRDLYKKLSGKSHYRDGSKGEIELVAGGSFRAALPFWKGPGIYTVVVWVKQASGKTMPATNFSLFVR